MKNKLTLAVITILTLATSANAKIDIHVGTSKVKLAGESATAYNIGWGTNSHNENGFYWGTQFDISSIKLKDHNVTSFGGDLKIGYSFIKDLTVYALVGALGQDLRQGQGLGFGYGAGIEYKAFNNVSLNVESKSYAMSLEETDYDFDSLGLNLKYTF